jgi:hypothetical protein
MSAKKFSEASCGAAADAYVREGAEDFPAAPILNEWKIKALEEYLCDSVHCTTALSCAA